MSANNEHGRGYIALRILVALGYVGAFAYTVFGITLAIKAPAGLWMVLGGVISCLGVYVMERVAKGVFIIRDHLTDPKRQQ